MEKKEIGDERRQRREMEKGLEKGRANGGG